MFLTRMTQSKKINWKHLLWIMPLVFLFGCSQDNRDCDSCCNCYSDIPSDYNTYVICDNQQIWDMRGNIADFTCTCDNVGCSRFPSQRECKYGIWVKQNGTLSYEQGVIHCTESIGKDRRCE